VSGERIVSMGFTPFLAYLYLMLVGSMAAYVAYAYLIRHTSPIIASSCMYVNPVVAVVIGALFLGEVITKWTVMATLIILGERGFVVLVRLQEARAGLTSAWRPAVQRRRIVSENSGETACRFFDLSGWPEKTNFRLGCRSTGSKTRVFATAEQADSMSATTLNGVRPREFRDQSSAKNLNRDVDYV